LPAPLEPENVEFLIRSSIREFLKMGFTQDSEIEPFCAQLPRHLLGGYGGNTPCIEVRSGDDRIIIDGGSGIRKLGYELMAGPCGKGAGEVHIFFTHFHWDHLIGLPFFTPIFIPGNVLHVYSVQPALKQVFETLFKKPYFPVPLEGLGAKIVYHQLEPRKPSTVGGIKITPYQLDHPDPCWGYKIEAEGKIYSHCVDTECKRTTHDELGPDLPLYQGVDLMTFDAQYTLMETLEKIDWGHAAASLGLDIAMRENIKRVLFMHHDPASSSEKVAAAEMQARRYYENQLKNARRAGFSLHEVEWSFAFDGLVVDL
jgi:phosphoribosyl 1,2-cyclic phosphodiesterase